MTALRLLKFNLQNFKSFLRLKTKASAIKMNKLKV